MFPSTLLQGINYTQVMRLDISSWCGYQATFPHQQLATLMILGSEKLLFSKENKEGSDLHALLGQFIMSVSPVEDVNSYPKTMTKHRSISANFTSTTTTTLTTAGTYGRRIIETQSFLAGNIGIYLTKLFPPAKMCICKSSEHTNFDAYQGKSFQITAVSIKFSKQICVNQNTFMETRIVWSGGRQLCCFKRLSQIEYFFLTVCLIQNT